MNPTLPFTVLLRYPDYRQHAIPETWLGHVLAEDPECALDHARQLCMATVAAEGIDDPDDYLCLALFPGHLEDLQPFPSHITHTLA